MHYPLCRYGRLACRRKDSSACSVANLIMITMLALSSGGIDDDLGRLLRSRVGTKFLLGSLNLLSMGFAMRSVVIAGAMGSISVAFLTHQSTTFP